MDVTAEFRGIVDVLCFGEVIVDFFPEKLGIPLRRASHFTMKLGGAPANVAVGIARLGGSVALHGAVGNDEFGAFLSNQLRNEGVEVSALVSLEKCKTAITFVSVDPDGERSFHGFREKTADRSLTPGHLDLAMISQSGCFHFGSNLLTNTSCREATNCALDNASSAGCLISFDPNIRLHLWEQPHEALPAIREILSRTHLVKLSEEEHRLLFPAIEIEDCFKTCYQPEGISAVVITQGARGATVITENCHLNIPARAINSVDTTGAGDSFIASLLYGLGLYQRRSPGTSPQELLRKLHPNSWRKLLELANYVAGTVCSHPGATDGFPRRDEIPPSLINF